MPSIVVGALLMFCVSALMAFDTVIARLLVADLHPLEIVFFRTLFSLIFMAPWIWRGGLPPPAPPPPLVCPRRAPP